MPADQRLGCALIVSLVNLDRFREVYGFVASDDLLRAVSLMLKDTLREVGNPNDFLGHFGPTDFIMVLDQDNLNTLKDRIHKRLDVSLDYFYRDQDRQTNVFKDNKLAIRTTEYLSWQSSHQELGQFKAFLIQAVKGA